MSQTGVYVPQAGEAMTALSPARQALLVSSADRHAGVRMEGPVLSLMAPVSACQASPGASVTEVREMFVQLVWSNLTAENPCMLSSTCMCRLRFLSFNPFIGKLVIDECCHLLNIFFSFNI